MTFRIVMEGPIAKVGGVSNHFKSVASELMKNSDVQLLTYDSNEESYISEIRNNIGKIYRRSVGFSMFLLKHRENYDIIHTQSSGGPTGFLSASIASFFSKLLDKKFVFTFHSSDTEGFVNRHPILVKKVLEKANQCILVSNHQKNLFSLKFGSQLTKKCIVIPNGYDANRVTIIDKKEARSKLSLTEEEIILLNVGHLMDYKGQKFLIEAMRILVKKSEKIHAYIIGVGPLKESLQQLICDSGLDHHCTLLGGHKSFEELNLWFNSCDYFILPSLTEGNPTVMFECLGYGKPFIGTNVGGIPEIIQSNDYGVLCPPADSLSLAIAIQTALEYNWDNEHIRQYSTIYTWENIVNQLITIYKRIG